MLEVLVGRVTAQERRLIHQRRRRIDPTVRVHTERIPAPVAEIVLHAGHAVHAALHRFQVVEHDAGFLSSVDCVITAASRQSMSGNHPSVLVAARPRLWAHMR